MSNHLTTFLFCSRSDDVNSGYVGHSRSVRSEQAIESHEIPLSMMNRVRIDDFLREHKDMFNDDSYEFLSELSVFKWKFVAEKLEGRSSWHHTSSYFNETNHYDLLQVAYKGLEEREDLDVLYKEFQQENNDMERDVVYGVMQVQEWGGSRRRPRLIGHKGVAGVVKGDWLYHKDGHNVHGFTSKNKISANKVEWLKKFDSYKGLVKEKFPDVPLVNRKSSEIER